MPKPLPIQFQATDLETLASQKGRIAIGVGAQGSEGAVSIGYGKRIGDRASFSFGASFSSGESSAGAGFGFDL